MYRFHLASSLRLRTLSSMGDWDEDDWDADVPAKAAPMSRAPAVPNSWEDEDQSEDESSVAAPKVAPASAPMKASKARGLALKEREKREKEREKAKALAREKELAELSEMERKVRIRKIVEEADLDNARDLFDGNAADAGRMMDDGKKTLVNFEPKTDDDYKKFAEMVGEKCRTLNKDPKRTLRYVNFVKDVMRQMTCDLGVDDSKELSTFMGLLSNEKREAFKKSKGHKKKAASKKTHVKVDRASDVRDDDFDDFDDFM